MQGSFVYPLELKSIVRLPRILEATLNSRSKGRHDLPQLDVVAPKIESKSKSNFEMIYVIYCKSWCTSAQHEKWWSQDWWVECTPPWMVLCIEIHKSFVLEINNEYVHFLLHHFYFWLKLVILSIVEVQFFWDTWARYLSLVVARHDHD